MISDKILFFILCLMTIVIFGKCEDDTIDLSFPDEFLIGTASSSYQVEGAWNVSDKAESIWDYFVHNHPEKIADRSTADITTDSYNKYKEDVKLLSNIGFNHYRFSISWSRLLPKGTPDYISYDGLQYYNNLLDELENVGIIPFVTLYHWDHPQILEEFGGWLNERMAYMFADYARVVFKEFGNRVKFFSTINEPYIFCTMGYRLGVTAPGLNLTGIGEYQCIHNMLKGHAMAYHIYDEEFRSEQNGQIGIVIPWVYSYSNDKNDTKTMRTAFEFQVGWTTNPIYSEKGDYPEIMKERIDKRSRLQGYKTSRFPRFSAEWIDYIKGTYDYFGLNHYTADVVTPLPNSQILDWPNDEGLIHSQDSEWIQAQSSWFKVYPQAFGDLLRTIKDEYNNPPVYVLENGVSYGNGTKDDFRINYLYSYMKEMLIAMKRDGCNVKAYTIWSFLDSFEWIQGYLDQFGLVDVNFKDKKRIRRPKKSAIWIKNVLSKRKLYNPFKS